MKIAVTYDNGEIFQHFGKTESFKVYEVEDNKVDRKSTRLNSSHKHRSRMPSSA